MVTFRYWVVIGLIFPTLVITARSQESYASSDVRITPERLSLPAGNNRSSEKCWTGWVASSIRRGLIGKQ
jgi:hypothetical protein